MAGCNDVIKKSIEISKEILELSDLGDQLRQDDGCGVLFGVMRDCAYKIKALAEEEKQRHIDKSKWD